MENKPRLRDLITLAKNGDKDAMARVVERFVPIVRKYGRKLGYEEACSDLVTWIIEAVHRYRPNTTWGRDELNHYFSREGHDQ
ncbi:MAG: helix-turn-helix domain-containing protein [Peptococcaceae bacterium]|nr:helix-turn-helix domain-containing protein [Peptococcaceae bacterium]